MADIGVPTFQQTAATRSGTGGEEEIAYAGQALAGAAEAIAAGMRDKKLRGFRDELGELGTTATEAVVPEGTMAVETEADFSDAEKATFENFRNLKQKADSTSGATRTRIINEGKAQLSQVLSTTSSARMRSALINEFNQWVSVNPALAQLGMQDQQDSIDSELAEKQLQEMFDQTYNSPSDGGFGISREVEFGGEEWVRLYSTRQAQAVKMNTDLWALEQATIQARTDAQAAIPIINKTLSASNNAVTQLVDDYTVQVEEVGAAQSRRVAGNMKEGDAETLAKWEAYGKTTVISDLLVEQAKLDELRVSIQGSPNVDEPAKAALARIDAQYQYIQRWIDAAENTAERPDLIQLALYEQQLRKDNFRRKHPEAEELIWFTEQLAPLLEMETLALDKTLVVDQLGQLFTMTFQEVMSKNEAFGSLWETYRGSADGLLRRSAFEIANAEDPYGDGTAGDPELLAEKAYGFMHNSVTQRGNYDQFIRDEKLKLPRELFNAYFAEASHIQMMGMGNNFQPASTKELERLYASDKIVEQTIEARSRGVTPSENNAIITLGEALLEFSKHPDAESMKVDIGNRKKQAAEVLNQSFGEVVLKDVIQWDFSELDQGKVSITLAKDAGERARTPTGRLASRSHFAAISTYMRSAPYLQNEMQSAVETLQEDVNRFLRYQAHTQFMRNPDALNPSYVITWDNEDYSDIFVNRPMSTYNPPPPLPPSTIRSRPARTGSTALPDTDVVGGRPVNIGYDSGNEEAN